MDIAAYFHRIGCPVPARPTLEALRRTAQGHALAIPFENLDPWLGRTPSLALADLEAKLVANGRGGYCFEHNSLLLAALREAGFEALPLAARVEWMRGDEAPRPRTHMLLAVTLEGETWLADVGFGGLTLADVLKLSPGEARTATGDRLRLTDDGAEWLLDAFVSGRWEPLYRFDLQLQLPADQEMANHFVSTHPRSQFVNDLIAARVTPQGRLALRNRDMTVYPAGGEPERRRIASAGELRRVLSRDFGINLSTLHGLEERIAGLF